MQAHCQFPNEIIDEVVDHLQYNKRALKAISLSSRVFLHRARKHLFATLVLQVKPVNGCASSLPSSKIFPLIESAPHLIPYIQVLEVAGSASWLRFDKEFSKALGLFQQTLEANIVTSSLRHIYLYNIKWGHFPVDMQAAIQRLLGLRSLKMVTLYLMSGVPWTIFKEISPNVTALSLKIAFIWPEDIGPLRDSTKALLTKGSGIDRLRIESLLIAYHHDPPFTFTHDSVGPFIVTHLRAFWVHVQSGDLWIRYQEFISHVSRSLETLGINFSSFDGYRREFYVTLPSLDCCQLANLKHLHIQTGCGSVSFPLQSAFLWLCESFETLPRQHQLQGIVIRCLIGIEECERYQSQLGSWPEVKNGLGWEHIDRFLTQPRFDSLPQIRVDLVESAGMKGTEYIAVLWSASVFLPRMTAKGTVVFKKDYHRSCNDDTIPHQFVNLYGLRRDQWD